MKYQLTSPLIPKNTVYEIFAETNGVIMKASIISAAILLAGIWFYSFKKLAIAACLFGASIICFKVLTF